MKEEPSISPDQQLELIERMLEESRKTVLSMGFPSMIWGGFVSIGTALSYAFASWHWYVAIGLLWALLMVSAFLLVVRHDRRKQQQQLKTTSLHKISNEMWIFIFWCDGTLWNSRVFAPPRTSLFPTHFVLFRFSLAPPIG